MDIRTAADILGAGRVARATELRRGIPDYSLSPFLMSLVIIKLGYLLDSSRPNMLWLIENKIVKIITFLG